MKRINLKLDNNNKKKGYKKKILQKEINKFLGITKETVINISKDKKEPEWMLNLRLKALEYFLKKPMPKWELMPNISLNFDEIIYYLKPGLSLVNDWKEVPKEIKEEFEALGIPQAEREILGGVGAQLESETFYHNLKKKYEKEGVIFEDMDQALKKYPELVKKYFSKAININDHKFISLHYAVWSGGTFIYVPKGVKVKMPLQSYFMMKNPGLGQFEHTIIIVEEKASLHYIEGCSAPKYNKNSIHAGAVEIFVKKEAYCKYSSVENWSKNVYNLNTKRAIVEKKGRIEWVGSNFGSKATMLYPCSVLKGEEAEAEHLSIAYANNEQYQDTGAKVIHLAPKTKSKIISKGISINKGTTLFRGLVYIDKRAKNSTAFIDCDNLLLDEKSEGHTIPIIKVNNSNSEVYHEAKTGKISSEKIFYLNSKGIEENEAISLLLNGFISSITDELPLEYAVELNKIIDFEIKKKNKLDIK